MKNKLEHGIVPATPGAREALQQEGKFVMSGAAFLHGEDVWLFTEDELCAIRFTEESIAERKHEVTARSEPKFAQLLAGREAASPVKPSLLTSTLRGPITQNPSIVRKVGRALVDDRYVQAARMHGEVEWLGTDEFSVVYAIKDGATVAVLFPFTHVPAAKA